MLFIAFKLWTARPSYQVTLRNIAALLVRPIDLMLGRTVLRSVSKTLAPFGRICPRSLVDKDMSSLLAFTLVVSHHYRRLVLQISPTDHLGLPPPFLRPNPPPRSSAPNPLPTLPSSPTSPRHAGKPPPRASPSLLHALVSQIWYVFVSLINIKFLHLTNGYSFLDIN